MREREREETERRKENEERTVEGEGERVREREERNERRKERNGGGKKGESRSIGSRRGNSRGNKESKLPRTTTHKREEGQTLFVRFYVHVSQTVFQNRFLYIYNKYISIICITGACTVETTKLNLLSLFLI